MLARGGLGLLGLALLALTLLAATAPDDDPTIETGRLIYERGVGREALVVSVAGGPFRPVAANLACAACHGADGEGGSEGTVAAPSLLRGAAEVARLRAALLAGRGADGRSLDITMPRYRLGARDLAALSAYMATLPDPPVPGVSADRIRMIVDPAGSGLSAHGLSLLAELARGVAADVRAGGGIFGREVVIDIAGAQPAAAGFVTLRWSGGGRPGETALSIRSDGGEAACGSLAPDPAALRAAVERHLTAKGQAFDVAGEAEPPVMAGRALIVPDGAVWRDRTWVAAAERANAVYLLPGAATPDVVARLGDKAHLVVDGDMAARAAKARLLIQKHAATPRDAIILASFAEGLNILTQTQKSSGRRLFGVRYCDQLKAAVERSQRAAIVRGNRAEVLSSAEGTPP